MAAYVHPIPDSVFLKMHQPRHDDAKDETWPSFALLADNFIGNIQASYIQTRDPVTRGNQIGALGFPLARVIIDNDRVYSFLVSATAHYAATDIMEIPRGSPHCGSILWNALCLRHRSETGGARVSKKEDLTHFVLNGFEHSKFKRYFDKLR